MAPRNTISKKKTVFKLSEICLDSIRKNFNIFIEAYEHSDDDQVKRSLLLLQKKYSSHFLNIFSNKHALTPYCLENTYFHFLINEYLRELNTSIFLEEDWEVALHYLKGIGQNFEKVTFEYRHPSKAVEPGGFLQNFVHVLLPYLTNISSLTMHASTRYTDETVKIISSTCKELKDLTFYSPSNSITEEGLRSLCPDDQRYKLNLKSLNLISFYHNSQPPAISFENGIAHLLRNMPSLEVIVYSHLPRILHRMHVGDLQNNSLTKVRKYNLTSMEINFDLNFLDIEGTLTIIAEVCPALKKLSLAGVTEKRHLAVTKFPNLVDMSITGRFDRERMDVDDVLRVSGKQLKVLLLFHSSVSVPLLLTSCPRLESLRLVFIKCTDFLDHPNLEPLCSLKDLNLTAFDASHTNATKSLQLLLKCCPNLEELQFLGFGFDINREVTGILGSFCERAECLRSLTFNACILDPGLLQHIVSTCRSLKTLVVECCSTIGMREIEALRNTVKAIENSELSIQFTCQMRDGDRITNAEDVISEGFVSNQADDETTDDDD